MHRYALPAHSPWNWPILYLHTDAAVVCSLLHRGSPAYFDQHILSPLILLPDEVLGELPVAGVGVVAELQGQVSA